MNEQFLTWDMLGTYSGTLGMVLILTQLTKTLPGIAKIPTQLYSYLLALVIMAVIAYGVNCMIPGANYLYMARPEAAPSVLDILPPNFALRLGIMAAVITAMYALAYLPWAWMDRKNKASSKSK